MPFLRTAGSAGAVLALLTACTPSMHHGATVTSTAVANAPSAVATSSHRASRTPALTVRAARWRLPQPLSRSVAFATGRTIVVAGGLTPAGTSTSSVTTIDPRTGAVGGRASLGSPVHDAAGFTVSGHDYVAGGGSTDSVATVQAVGTGAPAAGPLPHARSDLAAVTIGAHAYLVGGYDGTILDPAILGTTDGRTYRMVGRLPIPVRYAAVTAIGDLIVVSGGQTSNGSTAAIQEFDTRTGRARVAGALPYAVQGAAAVTLGTSVYVCGGQSTRGVSALIWRIDVAHGRAVSTAHLPYPVMNPAVTQVDGLAYLLGGENPRPIDDVVVLTESTG